MLVPTVRQLSREQEAGAAQVGPQPTDHPVVAAFTAPE